MEQINCKLSFNRANSQVLIDGIDSGNFTIDYSADIDFTPLVKLLSEKIENEKKIELICSEEKNPTDKEKILMETLKKIINSFNQSFSEVSNMETKTAENSEEKEVESDDLPF